MLGDDANIVFIEFLKQLLEIIKILSNGKNGVQRDKTKVPKQPKIRFGSLTKKDFEKLKKAGIDFKYLTFPKEKLAELERTAKDIGGSFFSTQLMDGNNAVIAVPSQLMGEIDAAIKHITAEQMKNSPTSLIVKDGNGKISEEDMKLTTDVLRSHDIPVYSFKSSDGKYMNVVPREFDGQYEAAMKEVLEIKKQLKEIEVTRYEQTAPLDSLDFVAVKLTEEEAQELYEAVSSDGLDVKFGKTDSGIAAVYPKELADTVQKARTEYKDSLEESEKYLIDVTDDTVTMDVEKLVMSEDNNSYFVRVPNTAALDYLRIDKSEVDVINGGKTLSMKLDMNRDYAIFDENSTLKSSRKGSELAECYNTKHKHVNKDTQIYQSGSNFRRIDLYCAEQNRLISLGINKASEIRTELLKQGISPKAADKLLADINDKLPDSYKEIFAYSAEKTEIVYADIPNIGEYLAQSRLSEQVIGKAVCFGELPKDNGSKCCVFDRSANQFNILPVLPRLEVMNKLTEMGYSELTAKEIADKVIGSYRDTDIQKIEDIKQEDLDISAKGFESNNPELANFTYYSGENSAVIVQESEDNFKYMEIDKGMPLVDVEAAVMKNFDIKDDISVAEIMKQLASEKIIDTPEAVTVGSVTVTPLSSNCIEIGKDGNSAIMPTDRIDTGRLSAIGVTDKEAAAIVKSFEKAENTAKHPERQTLQTLKNHAAAAREKINAVKNKAKAFTTPTAAKGQDR
ncbi:MAG: hypothetical protein K2N72_13910 [Oscillospiraceae bacterium]|nr:hypothetical protein [Oscillospiraceae bacterium]